MVSVEIVIVTTTADRYARYHGKSINESLDSNFWDTQPEKRIPTSGVGFTHTQTVELAEGSHYVIYGNSASSSYPWHAKIFISGTLVAEGNVVRGSHLRGDFTITEAEPPSGEPYTVIDDFSVPASLPAGSDVNVSILLRNTGDVAGYLTYGIIGNPTSPDSYMSVEEGSTYPTSVAPGGSMWLDVYLRYDKMPSWDFNLTATNADGTSTISKTISPSVPGEPYTQVTDFIIPESLPAGATIGELTVVVKNAGTGPGYLSVGINSEDYTEVMGSSYPTEVAVGGTFTFYLTLGINTNMPNEDFILTATNQDGTSYITKTITLAEVVNGHIHEVAYWIEGMAGWENFEAYPTPAKVGDDIHIYVLWINDGSAAAVGNVLAQFKSPRFYVYRPDAIANQDKSAVPGSGAMVQFAPVTLNESGSWEFYGRLTLDGTVVDFKKFNFGVEEVAVGVPTTLTLSAPDKAGVNEKFNISGILYETETVIPIPSMPIKHSYDGKDLGSSITGVDGDYLKEVSIPAAGTWTIKSDFLGTETLQTSRALADAVVAAKPIATALFIAGPIAMGIALFVYGTI